ncbi:hypothetical protein J2T57_001930 [Natronocella acetinitrilica]|uniref:DUF3301 domain-containing protein n=1 Tax=Natronocella acetinitrilica TaxID=414046 RepID=A0AAE3G3M2_9GAMM|nr:DUF3301 domain-containing protein [Natronocella acetinitrilica]MCP1674792.1 hypothetical protein [Natronocella acetinitrilica]
MSAGFWLLLPVVAAVALWYKGLARLEQARSAARRACRQAEVQFLDDSVVRDRWKLLRGADGRLRLATHYKFEFASRGDRRYTGTVTIHGGRITQLELEPWADESRGDEMDGERLP